MLTHGCNVFVTGVTGLIGGELVRSLVRQPVAKVWALVRPTPDAAPALRLATRVRRSGTLTAEPTLGVRAVAGDVTRPRLGLSDVAYEEIRREVDIIIHSAAETSFIRAAACRQTNIAGAANFIEFTRACERQPLLVCLSTAYVSGVVANTCLAEDDVAAAPTNDHHNEYTHSKAVAEQLFRSSGLPVLVVRPSIVMSAGLPDPAFARAILNFVPLLQELDAVPVNPAARPDIVPVQYVVDCIIKLLQLPQRRWDCYHISAGATGAATCEQLARVLDRFYQRPSPMVLIPPHEWTRECHRKYVSRPEQRKVFATLRNYLPFLNMNVLYNNERLHQELGERFVPPAPMTAYFPDLLRVMSQQSGHRLRAGLA